MPLARMGFRVLREPERAAAWQVRTAPGEHGLQRRGQRDVIDRGDRAQAGEDRCRVVRVEEAVPEDDDGSPAVLEKRDGQLCGL